MNYTDLLKTIMPKLLLAVSLINNIEVAPAIRQRNQEILFNEVGNAVYAKTYDMASFDFDIHHTKGKGINNQHYGLAQILSGAAVTGADPEVYTLTFLTQVVGKAQGDAFEVARESGKVPTVNRSLKGKEPCQWCIGLAGTYEHPNDDVFRRHENCTCEIHTSGWASRNGLLDNYVKVKKV